MTYLCVWNDSLTCVQCIIDTCHMPSSNVLHDSFVCVTWLIDMCCTTRSYSLFLSVTWLVTNWHAKLLNHTGLGLSTWNITRSYADMVLSCPWRDSWLRVTTTQINQKKQAKTHAPGVRVDFCVLMCVSVSVCVYECVCCEWEPFFCSTCFFFLVIVPCLSSPPLSLITHLIILSCVLFQMICIRMIIFFNNVLPYTYTRNRHLGS